MGDFKICIIVSWVTDVGYLGELLGVFYNLVVIGGYDRFFNRVIF